MCWCFKLKNHLGGRQSIRIFKNSLGLSWAQSGRGFFAYKGSDNFKFAEQLFFGTMK